MPAKHNSPTPVSLGQLVAERRVTARTLVEMQQKAAEMLAQARAEGLLGQPTAQSFLFGRNGRLSMVAPPASPPVSEQQAVRAYGDVLLDALIASSHRPKRLTALATACVQGEIATLEQLELQLERRMERPIYWRLIALIALLLALLWWLSHR